MTKDLSLCLKIWRQSKQEDREFLKRIRVYFLPDAMIGSIAERVRAGVYWKQQLEEIDALIKEHGASVIGGEDFKRYKLMRDFALHVGDILSLVMDTLQPTTIEQFEDFGFEDYAAALSMASLIAGQSATSQRISRR